MNEEKRWYMHPTGKSVWLACDSNGNPPAWVAGPGAEVRVVPIVPGTTDLLSKEEREALEWLRNRVEDWAFKTERDMGKHIVSALDRLAPKPVEAWVPKAGDRVKWYRGKDYGTGCFDHAFECPQVGYRVQIDGVSFWVDRVEPLETPPCGK